MRLRSLFARILVAAFVCMAAPFVAPRAAHADYAMPNVSLEATVLADGSLAVEETRTFSFDDDVNGVYWEIPAAENQQGAPLSIAVTGVSVRGNAGDMVPYREVPTSASGSEGVYTVERTSSGTTVKVFAPRAGGETLEVIVSYTAVGAVMSWADTAELYWKFVGPDWEEASENVSLRVDFAGAASAGVAPTIGENFRAWAHGPLEGTVALDDDASVPSVDFTVSRVQPGEFAEARIAFPTAWVPGCAPVATGRMDEMVGEEQAWADEANARREQARALLTVGTVVQVGVSLILLVGIIWLRVARFRSPQPVFQETYFRDVPSDDHPAVLSALLSGGAVEDRAFVATLMKLTDDGVVELVRETREEKRLFGTKEVEEYRLRLIDRSRATKTIDEAALALYFGEDAADGTEMDFGEMAATAKRDASATQARLDDFKAEVSARLAARNLTNCAPLWFRGVMPCVAFAVGVASFVFSLSVDTLFTLPFLVSLVCAVVAAVLAATTKTYTSEAVELLERCRALKRWLEDFTNLHEAVPADLILWNKLLVLAVAFGVSDEVLRQLADAVPREVREDELTGSYRFPLYWWCYAHGGLGSPTEALHSAYAASVSTLSASSNSSGGGLGGGFSGGGGGGVGGGGGGTF